MTTENKLIKFTGRHRRPLIDEFTRFRIILHQCIPPLYNIVNNLIIQKHVLVVVLLLWKLCYENLRNKFKGNTRGICSNDVFPRFTEIPFRENHWLVLFNRLIPGPFLYHLKTSDNLWFSDVFRGYKRGKPGGNWLIICRFDKYIL